jgi:hypothetical protein
VGCAVGCPVGTLFVFTGTTTTAASMHGVCCAVSLTIKDTLRAFPLFLNCLQSSPLDDAVAMDTLTVLVRLAMNSWLELFEVTVKGEGTRRDRERERNWEDEIRNGE